MNTKPKHIFALTIRFALTAVIVGLSVLSSWAQYPLNYATGNYSAIVGATLNPASLADSRHRFAFMPFGMSTDVTNNFIKLNTPYSQWKAVRGKVPESMTDENGVPIFFNSYMRDRLNGKSKQAYASASIMGPSMMFGLPNKFGVGVSTSTKTFVHVKNLNEDLMKIFVEDFDTTAPGWTSYGHQKRYINKTNNQERFGVGALAYQEIAVSVADVLYEKKQHFVKGGFTYKYLIGLSAGYLSINNLGYTLRNVDSIEFFNADMTMAYVSEDYYTDSDRRLFDFFGKNKLGSGSAIDIGVVYEYRPNIKNYYYRMDRRRLEDRTVSKYLFKIGGSITDFGRINFNNPSYARHRTIYSDTISNWQDFESFKKVDSGDKLDSFFFTLFPESDSTHGFVAKLPSSFNVFFDYQFQPKWFVGGTYIQTLRGNKVNGSRKQNMLSLNCRYEGRVAGAGANFTIGRNYGPVALGVYARFGPFYLGTNNLGSIITPRSSSGFSMYGGVQIPILHNKIPDADGDHVSDAKDECPQIAGEESAHGCPDFDEDRVPDSEDLCPELAGSRETQGCPDPDNDGLVLGSDKCPDQPGLKENEGCPDSDGDGLADHIDECPEKYGTKARNGCPMYADASDNDAQEEEETPKTEPVKEEPVKEEPVVAQEDPPKETPKVDPPKQETPIVQQPKQETPKTEPPKKETPKVAPTNKPLTVYDIVDLMNFDLNDYYLILGAYQNKELADALVRKLNNEAGVLTYIFQDERTGMHYVTFGRATDENMARKQLKELDKPAVNSRINGHVWWKKVPK
ncbi:MAG: SPOR domain-containing protein [Flavobacteriales bacterium]|nr:SPOR domain-containing protein [Bacteroidota bacterium]MCB9240595.1 SPOR domain-containing protein [Flavobacteriales bacterium]